jgi:hypothetical protein
MTTLPVAVTLCLLAAGLFLLWGMALGVVKYRAMMASETRMAPIYIDIAHRAALMYSFAALVMGELLRYSPYSTGVQLWAAAVPLALFAIAIAKYMQLGFANRTDNQFRERNFETTWGVWLLAFGEIGGLAVIVAGFIQSQWPG